MNNKFIGSILFFLSIITIGFLLAPFISFKEGFSLIPGNYPNSVNKVLLDDYQQIGKNILTNNNASDVWWKYPTFSLPSFKQITNNLRYFKNPDIGTCIRSDFCGALYKDKKNKPNEIYPLSPVEEGPGARVGYFRAEPNLLDFSIPTNENILY